jgi:cell wall-associated NlpC family hydrolase
MGTALGRAGFGATAGFGYSNPTLGGAAASQAAAQLYSGQTSMLFRQLGYGATPRAPGGVGNPMAMGGVMQSILQRAYGRGSVNQTTLNAGLANNGKLRLNLQALGLDPNTMGPALQMYNKMFSQGASAGTAQTLLNDAAHNANYNGQSAQKILSQRYGIATSDLQKLKDTQAVKTGTTSGEMGGFDSAISQATTSLQKFDMVLNSILKVTGLGSVLGASHGFSGTMSAVGGALGGMVNKGIGMLTRFGGAGGAAPGGTGGHGTPGSTSSKPSGAAATAIKDAEGQLGRPYVWGGDNPAVGFDCSGLVEWAYGQAGIKLPRTSQEQWAALKGRSVSMDKIMAGDILFSAGSDGSPNNPGHEAMAISGSQIIEAPYTGANIRIRALNKGEWSHAARPSGSMNASGGGGGTSGSNGKGNSSSGVGKGNSGLGLAVGDYGSSEEVANVAAALLGGASGGGGYTGFANIGNGQGRGSGKGNLNVSTAGGGNARANRALGQKLAKEMYGWTGPEWNALDKLWGTYESGWRNDAQNPGSTAFGIAQFLDSTWRPYGSKTSNAGLQIKYGLEYVHDRYKDPIHALQFELSHTPHWYDGGTRNSAPGLALVGERGPELVKLGGGQQVMNASKTADILKGSHAKPGQTPWDSQTARDLFLSPAAQNNHHRAGKAEVNLNMPAGAIVIHTQGSPSDVSNAVRQIMAGIRDAMVEDDMIQKIQQGVMG